MSSAKKIRLEDQISWSIEAIIADSLSASTVPCTSAFVGIVRDQKELSGILHLLGEKYPLKDGDDFRHLKRIRRNKDGSFHIFICHQEKSEQLPADTLGSELFEVFDDILTIKVPSGPLKTRSQFNFATKMWPCKFHEDKNLEGLLHKDWPDVWGDEAKMQHISRIKSLGQNSALLIDPKNQECIQKAESKLSSFLERHTVMVLIANLARARCIDHGQEKEDREHYLCTGLDLYITCEPCLMCCMALVHSRIRRVFFSRKSSDGGLSCSTKIQTINALNHSFQVFHVHENT